MSTRPRFSALAHVSIHYIRQISRDDVRARAIVRDLEQSHGFSNRRAERFVERLLTGILNDVGDHYHEVISARLKRIETLRERLGTTFDSIGNDGKLPEGVTPQQVQRWFGELEHEVGAIESPTRWAENEPHLLRDDAAGQRLFGGVDEPSAIPGDEAGSLFDHRPPGETGSPGARGGDDVILARNWRNDIIGNLRGTAARQQFQQQVVAPFVNRFMPPGTQSRVVSLDIGQVAVRDAFAHLSANDLFLPRGVEVQFTVGDITVQPDGVRFVSPERYLFREHKAPREMMDRSFFASGEGQKSLRQMLARHATFAERCSSHGCAGFEYSSGQRWLDDLIGLEITRMRVDPALGNAARLLHAAP